MKLIWEAFSHLLEERLVAEIFTTEDSIRYTFFLALMENSYCDHTEIILEMSHPSIPQAEIDLYIKSSDWRPATAFEFKYDRPIPSEKNAPRTQKAGAVFKDLFRLARVPDKTANLRFFIYVTAKEMADYFRNPSNNLVPFFELQEGQRYSIEPQFIYRQATTFQNTVGKLPISCQLVAVFRRNLSKQHYLRIYQVQNAIGE